MKFIEDIGYNYIYWSAPENTEGLTDVKIRLINHDGNVLIDWGYATELGDGIYQISYNFINTGWYISTGYSESLNGRTSESILVADDQYDYIYGTCNDSTSLFFEVNLLDGSNVLNGFMNRITNTEIWWVDITGLQKNKYFFKMNYKDSARFNYPFRTNENSLVLEPGYNISSYPGSGKFNFDSTTGIWVYTDFNITNTKASDLFNYINYYYSDVNIRYIKSYYENPIKRFKVFIPNTTPKSNENNFPLIQMNQVGESEHNSFYIYIESISDIVIKCK